MHPRALVDITAELLNGFRAAPGPADKALTAFVKEKKFLGGQDRRFVSDSFFGVLRHLARIDQSIRIALEDVHYDRRIDKSIGFPITIPPVARVWADPITPRERPSIGNAWIDSMRVTLAAEIADRGFTAKVRGTLVRDWPFAEPAIIDDERRKARIGQMIDRMPEVLRQLGEERKPTQLPLRHSFPDWLWGLIGFGIPPAEVDALGESLNRNGGVCLRVNTLRTTPEKFRAALKEAEIHFSPGKWAPECVVLDRRIPQGKIPGFDAGHAEFQDAGSQMITAMLDVRPGMSIIDACAGAGGKTLQMAAIANNKAAIRVHDVSRGRLKNLAERAERGGAGPFPIIESDAAKAGPRNARDLADLVLIDAPCTGTGTLRRSPDLKWRLTRETLQERCRIQRDLLNQWSAWVKPGGRLAYVTCSLLNEENGAQIDAFLAQHPDFQRADDLRPPSETMLVRRTSDVQLYPHRHDTDGFFLSVLRKSTG